MASPSVDVNIPLLGWTYIGGPSLHLLVGLPDTDARLVRASDAADLGDLDAVIACLTEEGVRNAAPFVGTYTGGDGAPPVRIVVHGATWAEVVSGDDREVLTPPSTRTYLDADVDRRVDRILLRVGSPPDDDRARPPRTAVRPAPSPHSGAASAASPMAQASPVPSAPDAGAAAPASPVPHVSPWASVPPTAVAGATAPATPGTVGGAAGVGSGDDPAAGTADGAVTSASDTSASAAADGRESTGWAGETSSAPPAPPAPPAPVGPASGPSAPPSWLSRAEPAPFATPPRADPPPAPPTQSQPPTVPTGSEPDRDAPAQLVQPRQRDERHGGLEHVRGAGSPSDLTDIPVVAAEPTLVAGQDQSSAAAGGPVESTATPERAVSEHGASEHTAVAEHTQRGLPEPLDIEPGPQAAAASGQAGAGQAGGAEAVGSYDHLFGHTMERDAYLAAVADSAAANEEHGEASDGTPGAGPGSSAAPTITTPDPYGGPAHPAADGTPGPTVGAGAGAQLPGSSSTATPSTSQASAAPASPVSPAAGGALISSVPWASAPSPATGPATSSATASALERPSSGGPSAMTAAPRTSPATHGPDTPALPPDPSSAAVPLTGNSPAVDIPTDDALDEGGWPVPFVPGSAVVRPSAPVVAGTPVASSRDSAPPTWAPATTPAAPTADSAPSAWAPPPRPAAPGVDLAPPAAPGSPSPSSASPARPASPTARALPTPPDTRTSLGPQFWSGTATLGTPTPGTPTPGTAPAPYLPPPTAGAADAAVADAADADADDRTVDRSALLAAQAPTGPSVMATLCPQGHLNPPHASRCRVCGTTIPDQQPFSTPRPPLGVLRMASGDVVTLDRGVLLGRAPKPATDVVPSERPHVVKVASPEKDVSRNHLEVLIDGWHVLIRDLDTTNGTIITLPGRSPVRLRPNDRQVIEPNTRISLADEVELVYDVEP